MKSSKAKHVQDGKRPKNIPKAGVHVKTGIHSGAWRCTSCAGQAVGSNLIKPKCDYCELS